jgi:hypothetical protein
MPRKHYEAHNNMDETSVSFTMHAIKRARQRKLWKYVNKKKFFYDAVYVTEVGLFNALGELVAIGKLSEPVEKNYINVLTFNIDIEM